MISLKTRITQIFGIQVPIILSGMSWISVPELVAAVSNAGALGILATGPMNTDELKNNIMAIRNLTTKPFGANVTLLFPGSTENANLLLKERIPVINFALGKGDWIIKRAHEYGGKVIATVATIEHAKKAEDLGADALIVTGFEAAAHGSEVSSLVLIRAVSRVVKIPIIAAGGFSDGRSLVAALVLGAEGIAMGSRFMVTKESPLNPHFKRLVLKKTIYDTLYSNKFDGLPSRVIKTEASIKQMKRGLRVLRAFKSAYEVAIHLNKPYVKLLIEVFKSGLKKTILFAYIANSFRDVYSATVIGDIKKGILPAGQVIGLIEDIPSVGELIEKIVREAEEIINDLRNKI